MSTLIAFGTQHGCTEAAAHMLAELLTDSVTLSNLNISHPDPAAYDTIIIGGSVHSGQVQKKVKSWCNRYQDTLTAKNLGLFLCCMFEGEIAEKQFNQAFTASLRQHAEVTGLFGGAFDFERMNFFQKMVVRKVAGVSESISKIDTEQIQQFAAALNQRNDQ